jgi:catechol 2,3-dioxygenase-like lactoylglutathione lyase family enzyme
MTLSRASNLQRQFAVFGHFIRRCTLTSVRLLRVRPVNYRECRNRPGEFAMTTEAAPAHPKPSPTLNLKFISHGTLECRNLQATRRFYEEFLGFETVQTSNRSLWSRLGGNHVYVCVEVGEQRSGEMPFLNHNGLDVETEAAVDECHQLVVRDAAKWGLHKISKPMVQHGSYSFFFWDADNNGWEILCNPPGGYSWMFERGDQQGLGHMSRQFQRPQSTLRGPAK